MAMYCYFVVDLQNLIQTPVVEKNRGDVWFGVISDKGLVENKLKCSWQPIFINVFQNVV